MMSGDFAVKLNTATSESKDVDALFSLADLDQKPRVVYQASPRLTKELRRKAPGTVYIIFIVNRKGQVEKPQVQKSTDPVFEKPALNAVKKWKFEPGKRKGNPVRFRMRVPITFPKG
jgi:protein TonB